MGKMVLLILTPVVILVGVTLYFLVENINARTESVNVGFNFLYFITLNVVLVLHGISLLARKKYLCDIGLAIYSVTIFTREKEPLVHFEVRYSMLVLVSVLV